MRITEVDQPVTQQQLNSLEQVLDKVFAQIGIDVEFTRHFLDRVNDERNIRQITISELGQLFKKEFTKWGKPIARLGPDAEAVMKDLSSDINIPFALNWNRGSGMLELVAKTVMRKKNFRTPNQEFPVESKNLTEGGAMPGVGAIHIDEIKPTLQALEKILKIDLQNNVLGSVGKKQFSGDIDVALEIDADKIPDFVEKLKHIPEIEDLAKSSVIMTKVKIVGYDPEKQVQGKPRTGYVQVDFMPGDPGWMKTYYHSPHEKDSKYKGVHRNIMIASIAGALDVRSSDETIADGRPVEQERWMWSPADGLIRVKRTPVPNKKGDGYTKKNSNEIIAGPYKSADEIAKILKLGGAENLDSFETLYNAVKKNYDTDMQKRIFDAFKSNPTIADIGMPSELGESSRVTEGKLVRNMRVRHVHSGKTGTVVKGGDRVGGRVEVEWDDGNTTVAAGKYLEPIKRVKESTQAKLTESEARIQHVEDLAIWHGSAGISRAIDTLKSLEKNPENVTVKWDGSPAVIFGRNENGEFVLTDKSGFGAKGYDGKVTSADAMAQMFARRGDGNPDENRKAFIQSMVNVWPVYEASVPADFRGYVHGDLLYYTTPAIKDGHYEFMPNTVMYRVKADSEIGKQIARSKAGVVLHAKIELDGTKGKVNVDELNAGDLLIMPPVTVTHAPTVHAENLDKVAALASKYGSAIDTMLDDNTLRDNKLSSFKNALYTYVNAKTKTRNLNNLAGDFGRWVDTAKISDVMKARMKEYAQQHAQALAGLFNIMTLIMSVKNDVIKQLDSADTDVTAYTAGQRGGEGYVIGKGDSKLVNRSGFTAANMSRER